MTSDLRAWIDRFAAHLTHERRMSGHTRSAYRRDLTRLLRFCERRGMREWSALDNFQVRAFAAAEHAAGLAPAAFKDVCPQSEPFMSFWCVKGAAG